MRRATEVHHEHVGPADRADIPYVRMPVRQQKLGIREAVRGRPKAARPVVLADTRKPNLNSWAFRSCFGRPFHLRREAYFSEVLIVPKLVLREPPTP